MVFRYVSVISTQDGSCCCSASIPEMTLSPPEGVKDVKISEKIWVWRRLEVVEAGEVGILFADILAAISTSCIS